MAADEQQEDTMLSLVKSRYLCRDRQIDLLDEYLRRLCPLIIIYGVRSTGKTSVTKTLMESSGDSLYAYLNCMELFSTKMVYESILNQLNNRIHCFDDDDYNNGDKQHIQCNSLTDFIEQIKQLLEYHYSCPQPTTVESVKPRGRPKSSSLSSSSSSSSSSSTTTTTYTQCILVFDSVDNNHHLFGTVNNNELMTGFMKICELTENKYPITCLFVGCQPIEWFCRITASPVTAIQINFDNYSMDEMTAILVRDCPRNYDKSFYQNYVNIIVKTLIQMSSNLREIRSICLANFSKYIEPITMDELQANETAKLYKRFQPQLLKILDDLPMKVVNKSADGTYDEWPDSMKYLLIASYLASNNSVKADKKVFVKYEGKQQRRKRKTVTTVGGGGDDHRDYSGPKGSPFERIFHCYRALIQLNAEPNDQYITEASNKLLSELQELVSLKLVLRTHEKLKTNWLSSQTKYQISNSVTFDFADKLAKQLNLNIKAFIE
ncbi:origin recognition complex subunit 5-like [Oppia nitens]|uniref:origin recognition complex subunit 5-like n=1 Tax=Oppia nitens TaxID=1686743 RepID=UPI0023DAC50D|nr:origin recognition complex subunit 5-like [Oppia nitens]